MKLARAMQIVKFEREIDSEVAKARQLMKLLETVSMADVLSGKTEDVALEIAAGLENLGARGNIVKVVFPEVQQLQNVAKIYGLF